MSETLKNKNFEFVLNGYRNENITGSEETTACVADGRLVSLTNLCYCLQFLIFY